VAAALLAVGGGAAVVRSQTADRPQDGTMCAVNKKSPVGRSDTYSWYKGKKVWLCCGDCKTWFDIKPGKYVRE
jgi:hypothetical protein